MTGDAPIGHRARVDALLAEALDRPPEERDAFLDRACARAPRLRCELAELLALSTDESPELQPGELAAGPLWRELLQAVESEARTSAVGERVGSWRLVRELGSGGMGTVYLAERDDREFEQTAAIKLMRPGAESEEILGRFQRERQILASLEHPNVARLLDGGRTPDGRPYFAMEYVEGQFLDAHCDAERLTIEERLLLFAQVARAVQHAHRNLIVHRDLKPSNIVVTRDGRVKLLDFGIAKTLAPSVSLGSEPLTRTAARLLTPEYASPEQVRGENVATATDIYQLGLLLYELLTGQRAHRFEDSSASSLERVICEAPVQRPSLAVVAAASSESAATRRTTTAALARRLRGDLDNIVLMALRKEPDRRYASAGELVEDIERHLAGRPVRARPDTVRYRAAKLIGRHPLGFAASIAIVLLLLAYVTTVTVQARALAVQRDRAEREADRARAVSGFLVGLFEAADPYGDKGADVTAGELVEAGAKRLDTELLDQPTLRAEMLGVLGGLLAKMSSYDRAGELLEEALELERREHGATDHPDLAAAVQRHATVTFDRGDYPAAEALAAEALEMRRRLFGERHDSFLESLETAATTLLVRGRHEDAEAAYRQVLAGRRSLHGDADHPGVADALEGLGICSFREGRYEAAIETYRASLEMRRRLFDGDHPLVAQSLTNLAIAHRNAGAFEEAESLLREAVDIKRRRLGDGHPNLANSLDSLGNVLLQTGRLDEAIVRHREALEIRRVAFGEVHSNVGLSWNNLGKSLREAARLAEAELAFRTSLEVLRETLPQGHGLISHPALALGRLLLESGRTSEAEPLLTEALEIRVTANGEESVSTAEARLVLGLLHAARGRQSEARELLEAGLAPLKSRRAGDVAPGAGDLALRAEAEQALRDLPAAVSPL